MRKSRDMIPSGMVEGGERLAGCILDDKAFLQFLDRPGRREAGGEDMSPGPCGFPGNSAACYYLRRSRFHLECRFTTTEGKGKEIMGKLAITLAAAALMLGSLAFSATAQTQQPGASSIRGLAQNATIIHKAACGGVWGRWCPPGRYRVCGPYRCWCAPC